MDAPDARRPRVSVVIPVFNDAAGLARCLRALDAQTWPRDALDVVVVDNGSTEPLAAVVEAFADARLVDEARPGSYIARNRGVGAATGEILAFTDADCVPAPDWITAGVARLLAEAGDVVVGGRIELFAADRDRASAVELFEIATALRQREYVERGGFAATANVFVRRDVFERVGGFDEAVKSGGDVEWGQRAAAAGCRLVYADDVCVRHPARATVGELHRRTARIIGGVHDMRGRKACRFLGIDRHPVLDFVPPVRYALTAMRHPELRTVGERARVAGVTVLARYMEAWERWRLLLGGRARR